MPVSGSFRCDRGKPALTAALSITAGAVSNGFSNHLGSGGLGIRSDGTILSTTGNGRGLFGSVKDSLFSKQTLGSVVSLSSNVIAEKLDVNPLLLSLGIRSLAGGVEGLSDTSSDSGAITRFFGGIGGALQESAINTITLGNENFTEQQTAQYLIQLATLVSSSDGNIFDAFEAYGQQVLGQGTVESLVSAGHNVGTYFKNRSLAGDYNVITFEDDTIAHEYVVDDSAYILNEEETAILSRRFGNHIETGEFMIDRRGRYVMVNGEMTFTNGDETLTVMVRDVKVVNVDMIDSKGNALSFFGTEAQPLVLSDDPQGSFKIESGVVRNWATNETTYFSNSILTATQDLAVINYKDAVGTDMGGYIEMTNLYDTKGESLGFDLQIDDGLREAFLRPESHAKESFWEFFIDNQDVEKIPENHTSLLEASGVSRFEIADNADAVVDKIFDFVKPQTTGLLEGALLFDQHVRTELVRSMIKGYVDVLRSGDRLDDIADNFTGAWKDVHDGNVTDAGKKVLAIGGHTFIETMRILDLAMIGGILRGTINAAGVTLEASTRVLEHEVADFVGRLMKRTDDLADSLLKRLFESSSLKGKFLIETKNVDDVQDVRRAIGKYVDYEEVKGINFMRNAHEVNLDPTYVGFNPLPHKTGADVIEQVIKADDIASRKWVRVHGDDNIARTWMMEESQYVELKSEAQRLGLDYGDFLKEKLQLPKRPTRASYFKPTTDEYFAYRSSTVNNPSNLSDNVSQIEILLNEGERLKENMFNFKELL